MFAANSFEVEMISGAPYKSIGGILFSVHSMPPNLAKSSTKLINLWYKYQAAQKNKPMEEVCELAKKYEAAAIKEGCVRMEYAGQDQRQ